MDTSLYAEFIGKENPDYIKDSNTDLNINFWLSTELYPKLISIPKDYHNILFAEELTPKLLQLLNIEVDSYLVSSFVGEPS
ncbi:putative DNA binding/transcriptional regulator [Brevibacillus phage Osiris]|uniref:Putative DNA binding/transcriptional regulator n=2 Tax=Brevibacillus phage Osiris TaxID=1691955 RepID=A0A0K2FM84_9CAUD|nr:putative DNA binding/transcriptional regulator [Brevibacillus phage Osiris]ALA07359.1 putative DNA binding/transcriptional regulator [Brevibacillus phage Osiris]ALA48028.1 putative DNA binding/transcriptional regulator [Brevibacillus phage Powder]